MSTTDDPLTELLGVDSSEFLAADWERHPRHIGSATTSFRTALSLDDMDEVVVRAESDDAAASQTVVLLFKALEQAHGYASAHAAFADGASIVINHVDKAWPPLNDLCARLGERFRYAFANLYFTPHASQTAPPHSDDRDVFVLQMHGAKRWRVWPCDHCDAQLLPFADEQAGKEPRPKLRADELGAPELECTLQPGDALYIPRGAIHVAETAAAEGECSLHVTVAIPTADLCWSGFVAQAATRGCMDSLPFRRALPLGPLSGEGEGWREAFAARWDEMLAVELGDARRVLAQKMDRHRAQQADARRRAEARQRTGADGGLRAGSRLRKAVAVEVIDARDGRLVVQAPDAYAFAPPELHAAAREFGAWAVGREFALGELPARHAFLRACVARILLRLEAVEVLE